MSRYTLTISCVLNMYGGCHEHEILPESGRASLTHGSREMHRRRDRTQDTAWSTGSVTVNCHCGRQEALCKTKLDKNLGTGGLHVNDHGSRRDTRFHSKLDFRSIAVETLSRATGTSSLISEWSPNRYSTDPKLGEPHRGKTFAYGKGHCTQLVGIERVASLRLINRQKTAYPLIRLPILPNKTKRRVILNYRRFLFDFCREQPYILTIQEEGV
jgi:hypothetical protein